MSACSGMSREHAYNLAHRLVTAYALDVPCLRCGGIRGVWCRTSSGARSATLHVVRYDLAGVRGLNGALARYVGQFPGWRVVAPDGRRLA